MCVCVYVWISAGAPNHLEHWNMRKDNEKMLETYSGREKKKQN